MLILLFNGQGYVPVTPTTLIRETWWPGIVSVLQGVCPEVTAIIRAQSINKANWENLILRNKITAPYIVVESGTSVQEDWGRDNITWRQPVNIHYVCSTSAASALADGGGYDIARYTEGRGIDISTSCISYSGSGFQILNDYPVTDVSEFSLANQTFYKLQAPLFASTVKVGLLWGASNVSGELSGVHQWP